MLPKEALEEAGAAALAAAATAAEEGGLAVVEESDEPDSGAGTLQMQRSQTRTFMGLARSLPFQLKRSSGSIGGVFRTSPAISGSDIWLVQYNAAFSPTAG